VGVVSFLLNDCTACVIRRVVAVDRCILPAMSLDLLSQRAVPTNGQVAASVSTLQASFQKARWVVLIAEGFLFVLIAGQPTARISLVCVYLYVSFSCL